MTSFSKRWFGLVLGATALLLAGCSDDDGSEESGTTTTESADTPTTSVAPEEAEAADVEDLPAHLTLDEAFLFDQEAVHTFSIAVDDGLLAEIDADPTAEEYVNATLAFNGEEIGEVGLRYKGSIGAFGGCTEVFGFQPSGAKTCRKLSMKLKIDWDDDAARFYDVKKVQLHSMNNDPSMMRERLGYWMFREMGVAAPRATHARVEINGEFLGTFALIEQIDGRFTRDNFEDGTGNLYKEIWPLTAEGTPQSNDVLVEGLRTNRSEDPTGDIMIAFAEEFVAAADEDGRRAVLEEWTDIDLLLRQMVVDRGIKHDDGPSHWYCFGPCEPHNFYWYENPTTQQISLIPWDLDLAFSVLDPQGGRFAGFIELPDAFGETSNDCLPTSGSFGLQSRSAACDPIFATLGTYDAEFDAIREELVTGPMSEESIRAQIETWSAQVAPLILEENDVHDDAVSEADWRAAMERLQDTLIETLDDDGR